MISLHQFTNGFILALAQKFKRQERHKGVFVRIMLTEMQPQFRRAASPIPEG